jgi:hypothetical protein
VAPDLATRLTTNVVSLHAAVETGAEFRSKAHGTAPSCNELPVATWLRQRHDATAHMQNLVFRLCGPSEPAELLKAPQEWAAGAFYFFLVDAAALHSAASQLWGSAWSWRRNGAG